MMSCCVTDVASEIAAQDQPRARMRERFMHSGHALGDGYTRFSFSVPTIHCGACVVSIEKAVRKLPGVRNARVNLTLKRLNLELQEDADVATIVEAVDSLGFKIEPIDLGDLSAADEDAQATALLKALAVAGFAAANIMLLSVSVWSGADGPTRDFFHLISAIIAVPVVFYSGRVFFRSAFSALKAKRLNMDVPISLAILLALGMSIFETLTGGQEAYFDAAVTLLFFLLIGRYFDQRMRDRARQSVVTLAKMAAKGANCVAPDGTLAYKPIDEITPGMMVRVFAGDRLPVDGVVVSGASDLDKSIATGESKPVSICEGAEVQAGCLNLTGPVDIEVTKPADQSFLSEILLMLEAAEKGRGNYVRIADRMASIYAPAVHLLALIAFIGWMFTSGGDIYLSLTVAIAVLIVTCPCALGLAVPVAHVVAASNLFSRGVLMRDGSALERLANIDMAVFDKTGTLTLGTPTIVAVEGLSDADARVAKAMAARSSHPVSQALAVYLNGYDAAPLDQVEEHPGFGIEAVSGGKTYRLGRAAWVGEIADNAAPSGLQFAAEGAQAASFNLSETLRPFARDAVQALAESAVPSRILSGDAPDAVTRLAARINVDEALSEQTPASKLAAIMALKEQGHNVLMVGDGINDAPSLAAGHVSMAPASAADVGRQAADFVFTQDSLAAVPTALSIARKAKRVVQQNFLIALVYNMIAVPLAMAGFVTPLVAAIAMSTSSILVVSNSLRLRRAGRPQNNESAAPFDAVEQHA